MKKKKLLAAAIVLCMVIQLLCACGKQKISMSDKVYVGVTCYDQNDTFLSELLVCFKEELNHLNKNGVETTVTVKNAAGSQRTQNDQVKELRMQRPLCESGRSGRSVGNYRCCKRT